MRLITSILGLFLLTALHAEIIPANRRTTWEGRVGVEGGIPTFTNIWTNLTSSASLATINAALDNCSNGWVVKLAAGTYNLAGQIKIEDRNSVVLRGSGRGTILKFTASDYQGNILVQRSGGWPTEDPGPPTIVNWTNGFVQGETNITLSSVSGLSVGDTIWLDQLDDNNDVSANASHSYEGCNLCGRWGGGRSQNHMARVLAINGRTVTIWPPLHMLNWNLAASPSAWWGYTMVTNIGIEDLSIDGTSSQPYGGFGANIAIFFGANCWVTGVYSTNEYIADENAESSHVFGMFCRNVTVRNNLLHGTRAGATMSYGIMLDLVHSWLVEDNMFTKCAVPILLGSASSGNVIAYNVMTNMYYPHASTYLMSAILPHQAHNCMNLIEGNWTTQVRADLFHGTSSDNTVFRNRIKAWEQSAFIYANYGVMLDAYNRRWNIVGNVVGWNPYHTHQDSLVGGSDYSEACFRVGWSTDQRDPALVDNDATTVTSLYRHGNYDTVTDDIAWASTNADHSLPSSLYLTSKPSWFGFLTWPPVNPEGASPDTIDPTNWPAGYRWAFGTNPPAGGPDETPPTISAIATNVTPTNCTVTWSTDEVATSGLAWGLTSSYSWGVTNASTDTSHSLIATNLAASTLYHFAVYSTDVAGNGTNSADFTFTTQTPVTINSPGNLHVIGSIRVLGTLSQ